MTSSAHDAHSLSRAWKCKSERQNVHAEVVSVSPLTTLDDVQAEVVSLLTTLDDVLKGGNVLERV